MDIMKVTIRYFAVLRDMAGIGEEVRETKAVNARDLINELISVHQFGLPSALIRPAINGKFALDTDPICDGDDIVLIPPVAGG
jgi:molybdopterin synthase sulfur carrier subunit